MASPLRFSVARAQIIPLPSTVRSALSARSLPRRNFSSTAHRPSALLDIAVAGPTAILDAIHGLGIPWYAAIPCAAVLMRCTVGYYLSALPARKRAIVRTNLAPLVANNVRYQMGRKNFLLQKRLDADGGNRPVTSKNSLRMRRMVNAMVCQMTESYRFGKRYGAPIFTASSFLNFGMLIMFAEAIRVKCGHREGLLSMITSRFEGAFQSLLMKPASTNTPPALSYEEVIAERMEAAQAAADAQAELYASGAGDVLVDPKLLDPAYHFEALGHTAKTYADNLDPTMLIEGLSWAQNLALPDPQYILPFLLSCAMLPDMSRVFKAYLKALPPRHGTFGKRLPSTKSSTVSASTLTPQSKEMDRALRLLEKLRQETSANNSRARGAILSTWTIDQKFRLWMAGLFFFVGCGLPSGMLLYMIPSVVVGRLHTRWLDMKHPIPMIIQPCKRPMRVKVKKSYWNS